MAVAHGDHIGCDQEGRREQGQKHVLEANQQRKLVSIGKIQRRVVAQYDAVDIGGERDVVRVRAEDLRAALANVAQELLAVARIARGISAPDAPQRMGVASGHPSATLRVVAKLLEQHLDEFAVLALLRAVLDLENLEQRGHPADVVAQVLAMREVVEEVVQDVKNILLLQVGDQLVSVLPHLLKFPVMLLGDVIDADVDGMAELGKPG